MMKKNKRRIRRQIFLLSFLLIVCLVSSTMIYLGATVFRTQLPIFQLMDGETVFSQPMGAKPPTNPGVADLSASPAVRLFMVLGSDYRPESGFRTDILMLIALDTISGKASIVSFPRDLWVFIPGYGEQRINTVVQLGGFPLMADTMQTNFGVYPTDFAMIDMEGFLRVVDELGGVEFETDLYTGDACDSSLDPDRWCEVGPGQVSLDSDWALWYVRARYNSSDFDRMRRTQEVVSAIMDKMLSPRGLIELPSMVDIYDTEVESNINPGQLFPLLRLAIGFNSGEDVRRFTIGPNEAVGWTTSEGASVLLPNTPAIQAILQDALSFD